MALKLLLRILLNFLVYTLAADTHYLFTALAQKLNEMTCIYVPALTVGGRKAVSMSFLTIISSVPNNALVK